MGRIAAIIFFLFYALQYFTDIKSAGVILAITALIIAISLMIGSVAPGPVEGRRWFW